MRNPLFVFLTELYPLYLLLIEKKMFITRKEGNVLFNDAVNTFYLRLYGVRHMVKYHTDREREETRCRHMGYSFRLTARSLLYAPSHRQDSIYDDLWYTSRGTLAGTRNNSMGPQWRIDPTTHRTISERPYHGATSCSLFITNIIFVKQKVCNKYITSLFLFIALIYLTTRQYAK